MTWDLLNMSSRDLLKIDRGEISILKKKTKPRVRNYWFCSFPLHLKHYRKPNFLTRIYNRKPCKNQAFEKPERVLETQFSGMAFRIPYKCPSETMPARYMYNVFLMDK